MYLLILRTKIFQCQVENLKKSKKFWQGPSGVTYTPPLPPGRGAGVNQIGAK